MEADRALREIAGEQRWKAVRQAVCEGFDLLTDLAPMVASAKCKTFQPDLTENTERKIRMLPLPSGRQAPLRALPAGIARILP
ncbi:MAG: hypothetical protein OXC10_20220 [Rhodospirillaceae bacterium]|nr:hypothetical protein [Rhodospirillaceae bacterium]